ncbi:MAG: peptidase M64 [Prevotella sp.]|nr:peptidase M64 [Prevotella sp.]
MRIKPLFIILCLGIGLSIQAQQFSDYFEEGTLRLDYIFSGNSSHQEISLDGMSHIPRWWGKHDRLSEVPVEGNGQVIVRDHRSGTVIYRHSFSTLFQEWLSYDEASTANRSFENVFLVPMPKDSVDITVDLRNNRRETMASMTHTVNPRDILIRRIGERGVTPYETLQQARDTTRCIHIAFLAEGYTENEMGIFLADAREAIGALFEHEPFKSMRDRFHIIAVKSPSEESGTSMPRVGDWRRTAVSSHFDTFYSDRYLTTLHLKTLHDWLAGTPYEHIIVLVNTDNYGGGGILNSYNLSMTHHPLYHQVVVHEFGHSFGGLGDEYAYENEPIPMYPHDVEPWEPNLTTLADFHGKWEDMIEKGTPVPTPESTKPKVIERRVGLFEGAGYSLNGVYRPCQDCRMRTNDNPIFCPVCTRALTRLIQFYTGE